MRRPPVRGAGKLAADADAKDPKAYAAFFGAAGAWVPYLTLYYRELGFELLRSPPRVADDEPCPARRGRRQQPT